MNIITLGTFDLLHIGHLKLFKKCRELAGSDKVIVGLNTDEFIESYKGKKPIMSYKEREDIILEVGMINEVIPNDQSTKGSSSLKTILDSGAEMIVIGSDWGRKDYLGQIGISWADMDDNGLSLSYVPYTTTISTTNIKERMK